MLESATFEQRASTGRFFLVDPELMCLPSSSPLRSLDAAEDKGREVVGGTMQRRAEELQELRVRPKRTVRATHATLRRMIGSPTPPLWPPSSGLQAGTSV